MSYETFVMLPTTTQVTLPEIETRLRTLFSNSIKTRPDFQISQRADYIELNFTNYRFYVGIADEPHVLREAQEIAAEFPEVEFKGEYDKRIEISADDDPNMDYFNDFVFIVEELQNLEGAIAYQHRIGQFI
jgi:hypothetical protein